MERNFLSSLDATLGESSQVVKKQFSIFCSGKKQEIVVFYIESLINSKQLVSAVLNPIKEFCKNQESQKNADSKTIINQLQSEIMVASNFEVLSKKEEVLAKIYAGNVAVVFQKNALCFSLFDAEKRSVEEPPTSKVVKGPREGFNEDILTNLSLIRKRVKTESLKIEDFYIGRQTKTHVAVMFISGIAKKEVVKEVEKRLKSIDIDAILDSYYIESFLEDHKLKFFRRVGNTEKPDVFASKILEGRVGILVDGSPIALTVPFMFFEDLQSPDDYYSVPAKATFARIMRLVGLIFAVLSPGVYVALQSYNYRLLPINFLITLISSIEGLSIPPLVEILVVLLLFEIITEASLQMPNALGMALSIIGALALGNTAVDAGIISAPSIVVVAVSSVALYIIPDQISETRIIRLLFTMVGGLAGLYGTVMCFLILTCYMSSIKSFGVPYFSMYAPSIKKDKKDGIIKSDLGEMIERPQKIAGENKIRQSGKTKDFNLSKKDNHDI